MARSLRWYDTLSINIYFLGLTHHRPDDDAAGRPPAGAAVRRAGPARGFYGTIRLWSLMMALLVQALMGSLSDRSQLRWGRRRPFILIGTLLDLVFITAIGLLAGLQGMTGYWLLFILLLLLQLTSNTAQAGVTA